MNEIDLYVELIDDKIADKILRDFNETVPGFSRNPSLQQKKSNIRNIFRGQTANIRKKRRMKGNPFYVHLSRYKTPNNDANFSSYDSKGLFHRFSKSTELTDYAKFALAMMYQPEALKENLPQLIQNFHDKRPLFELDVSFETQEEVEAYLRVSSDFFSDERIEHFLKSCRHAFTKEELNRIRELEKEVAALSLLEFHNKFQEFSNDPNLSYYAYAVTHLEEDPDFRLGIALMVANRLINKYREKVEVTESKLKSLEENFKKAAQFRPIQEELKKDITELNEKVKEIEREKHQAEREKNELEAHVQRLISENELLKEERQKELEQTQKHLEAAKQQIDQIVKEFGCEGDFQGFAVVYSGESEIFRIIFPEIMSFSIKDWNQKKNSLLSFHKVYFQRDGLNTKLINNVQSFCRKNNLKPVFFIARNEKEFIELIAHYKRQPTEG